MVDKYNPLITCSMSFVLCFVCIIISYVLYATKCLNKIKHILYLYRWPFGDVACRLMHYMINVTAYVTVYTLVLVSVIRYMTIVHATSTAPYRTSSRVVAMIVTIWILMLSVNTPVVTRYGTQVDESTGVQHCVMSSPLASRQLYATFFAFAYVIPLIVIVICSVSILRHIKRLTLVISDTKK